MKKTYASARWVFLASMAISTLACSSSPRQTEIVNSPNDPVTVRSVYINKSEDIWHIWGELQSISHSAMQNGRIRISTISADGKLLQQKEVVYRRRIGIVRHHRTRYPLKAIFSTTFESMPENLRVIVEHVPRQE